MAPHAANNLNVVHARDSDVDEQAQPVLGQLLNRDMTPAQIYHELIARDAAAAPTRAPDYSGAIDPTSINMKGIQALIAIICVGMVLGTIWFFCWAKNGGFQWRKGDWDDYKSTVLRRKGPNGTTLSNATKSTKLGGGSIVGDGYSDDQGSTISGTMTETMTEMTETMTDMSSQAPIMKEKQARRETAKDRKVREAREAQWEGGHDNDMRAYRHEKPARVGGINKDSEAMYYGTDYTETDGSVVQSQTNRSNVNPNATQARPRQPSPEKRQQSARRDFSFGNDAGFSVASSQEQPHETAAPAVPPHRPGRYHPAQAPQYAARAAQQKYARPQQGVPGAYQASGSSVSDVQNQRTKAYHHPIPGLNTGANRGFRRDRSDSLDN